MFQRHRLWSVSAPHIEGMRAVSSGHSIHFAACGRATGKPVVFLHGGPGKGIARSRWQFFNPGVWRIILIDQRGCGASEPVGSLTDNTTRDLIGDLEEIREYLGIDRWTVFGSGWGSFLSLAYAIEHPTRVSELIVSDILLFQRKEIDWLFKFGASEHFPEAWEEFLSALPERQRDYPLAAYYRIFTEGDESEQRKATAAWSAWESATSGRPDIAEDPEGYQVALTMARIECHYFYHRGFLADDRQILDGVNVLRQHEIPGIIVHGERDMVTPVAHARDLHLAWPEAELVLVPNGGHSTRDPDVQTALLAATEKVGGCGCLFKWPS